MSNRIRLNARQVAERLGVSKQTVWRWYTAGDFLKPHYLGQNRVWWLSDVEAWESEHTRTKPDIPVYKRAQQGHAA